LSKSTTIKHSIYSGGIANKQKSINKYTEEEIQTLIDKANAYMKAKPYRSASRLAIYLGVNYSALKWLEKLNKIELPLHNRWAFKGSRIKALHKIIKNSWEK